MAEAEAAAPGELLDREDVDRLYDLDPGAFVPARDALAKTLRKAGDRPAAAAVRNLRRPTVTAWALNQVARRQPDDVAALLEAAEAVGAAQAVAVGSGGPEALRAATKRRRELVAALARAATALAGPAHADEIEATLLSAGSDPEAGAALSAGRLVRELATPVGFGLFGLAEPDPATADTPDDHDDRPAPHEATPAPEHKRAVRKKRAASKKPAATTRQTASARASEVERRRQEAAAAAEALAAAASAVGAAERELADATSALASARATLARASAASSEASSALADLDG